MNCYSVTDQDRNSVRKLLVKSLKHPNNLTNFEAVTLIMTFSPKRIPTLKLCMRSDSQVCQVKWLSGKMTYSTYFSIQTIVFFIRH